MRLTVINILLLLSLSLNAQMAGRTIMDTDDGAVPPTYLAVAHYPMNGNGNDTTGNGNHATLASMAYGTGTPAAGTAYGDFSSTTPEFRTPSSIGLTDIFTWSFWFRQNASGGYYEFIDPHRDNTSYEHFFIWADGVQHDFEFRGYQDGTNSLDVANTNTGVWTSAFVWNNLIVTYDGTGADGIVTMCYNGNELTMSNNTTWNAANMTITSIVRIGESFSGHIDEVSIFDVVLSAAQKTELYNGGVPGYIL